MNKVTIRAWEIETTEDTQEVKQLEESIFSQGNGYMGVRGYQPEGRKKDYSERSTFLAGFFEAIRPGITDMVNQPDFSWSQLLLNGLNVMDLGLEKYSTVLNMKDGTLRWVYTVSDNEKRKTKVEVMRFLSMENKHVAAIRFMITPLNYSGDLCFETGIDGTVRNLPISDNQLSENTEYVRLWEDIKHYSHGNCGGLTAQTGYSKRVIAMEYHLILNGISTNSIKAVTRSDYTGSIIETYVNQGITYGIDKVIAVASFRDDVEPAKLAVEIANGCQAKGFDQMLLETQNAWNKIWEKSDIKLDTKEELQGAVRYNIFQLIQNCPAVDPYASIGARGLMHGRYKGCYFWDTEIFMFPLFLHTNPIAAKNLLLYRYHTLNDAIISAKAFSVKGARYSWMSSDTGYEQCETWDTGCCEIHITADVAYAMGRYLEVTKDESFLRDYAAEVFIQTARYWSSRFTYHKKRDQYNLLFVKGPDEYCGVTTNNFYTVRMAVNNLKLAQNAVTQMEVKFPKEWEQLVRKIDFHKGEMKRWEEIIQKVVTHYDEERKLWLQDDTFELLEPLDIRSNKDDDIPLYHKISYDRLQRYQVLKQPDVLMLMALFPEDFSDEELQAAWNYYEEKTLHDSTLSFGIHAILAARLGKLREAEKYFEKSAYLDLHDIMNNTVKEGIHVAALGASWQALIFGYAGIWVGADGISCKPHLPDSIQKMQFTIYYQGKAYRVMIDRKGLTKVQLLADI